MSHVVKIIHTMSTTCSLNVKHNTMIETVRVKKSEKL